MANERSNGSPESGIIGGGSGWCATNGAGPFTTMIHVRVRGACMPLLFP